MASRERYAAAFIVYNLLNEKKSEKIKKKRRVWTKEWISRRNIEGAYAKLLPEIERNHPDVFRNFFQISISDFNYLVEKISPIVQKQDTVMRKAISPGERLAITLRFLSTGDSYQSLMYLFRVPESTISTIVLEVCMAIYAVLKNEYLKIPETEEEWKYHAKRFEEKCFFPNCFGALDGKHVVMKAPAHSGNTKLCGRQRIFNYRLPLARRIVENTFGILSARFRVLRKPIELDAEKCKKVVLAACALHNFIMSRPESKRLYVIPSDFDNIETDGRVLPGNWRQETENSQLQSFFPLESPENLNISDAEAIRQTFTDYFLEEGELGWQYQYI